MLFNSLEFLVFFVCVYALYLVLPHRGQNGLLLIASYFFYGCWDYRFLALIALSTTVDFFLAQKVAAAESDRARKWLLAASMATGLGILGFFKYFNFFVDSAEGLIHAMGFDPGWMRLNIVLPVGISFYTFQSMSYTIDVYRGVLKPTTRYFDYALYVSLFTQLVAGPIERATHLLPQVLNPRSITWQGVRLGLWLFGWGLFKKLVIADNAAIIADQVFSGQVEWTAGTALLGVYAFALQIYCDFSGYSDMARGLGFFLGFNIMVNFRNPYFALNPSDFWRRWHISLSTWLRDYLYIPLGGNRKGPRRTYINLMLTMVLGGLWHGAAWTFVFWGLFHGGLLAAHRYIAQRVSAPKDVSAVGKAWRMVGMFHAVCFSWLLFRAESMADVGGLLAAFMLRPEIPMICWIWIGQLLFLSWPLGLVQIMQERTKDPLAPLRLSLVPRLTLYAAVMFMLITLGNTGHRAFIYFQF
jgi:alginate O-acetyltransferase complex protein AlgI